MILRATFCTLFLALAALGAPARAATAPEPIVWRGDVVSARAFVADVAKEYEKEKKGKVTVQPFSTVSGIDAVAQGSADLAGSARGKYATRAEEQNVEFVPVALDAIVPIAYPKNPVSNLTLKQVRDLYLGKITNWKDLGGADAPINLYAIAAPLDGVEFSLRALVFKNGDQRVAAPRLYINTAKLEEAIAIDPNGLGLSTLSSTATNKGVKLLSVQGVPASTESVASGNYPLFTPLYIGERAEAKDKPAVAAFVAYLDGPKAKAVMRSHQLVPWTDAAPAVAREAERLTFIESQLAEAAATVASSETPISAPNATLASKTRLAPTSESTQEAKIRAAQAALRKEKEDAAKKADSGGH